MKIKESLLVGLLFSGLSQAGVITFNSLSGSFSSYTEQGVTFTPVGGGTFSAASTPIQRSVYSETRTLFLPAGRNYARTSWAAPVPCLST